MVNKRKAFVYQFSFKTLRACGTLLKQGAVGIIQDADNLNKIRIFCECLLLKNRINELTFNIAAREGGAGYDIILWIPAYDTPSRVARDVNSFYKKVFEKGVMDCAFKKTEFEEMVGVDLDELSGETFYV